MKQTCAFCGRARGEVKDLLSGPQLFICNECIEEYNARLHKGEVETSRKLRQELEKAVSDSFRRIVANLDLGPLHEKYRLLMKVKFKEEPGGPSFQAVFDEFKRGVEQVIAPDDYQARYDLGIAYNEMGLKDDAFRELIQSLRFSLKHKDWEKAIEILAAVFYIGYDAKRVIEMVSEVFQERG
jgi:hypothetical protein